MRIAEWAAAVDEEALFEGIRHWLGARPPDDLVTNGVPFALVAPPPGSPSLIERYTALGMARSRAERTLLSRWEQSRFLILKVLDVAPGEWFDVHDVLFDTAFRVHERSGTENLPIGTWLAAFVFDEDGRWQLEGTVLTVPEHVRIYAVQAAVRALQEMGVASGAADPRTTRRTAWPVIAAVNDALRTPRLVNSDGHDVVLVTSTLGEPWERVVAVTSSWPDARADDDTVTIVAPDPEAMGQGVLSRGTMYRERGRVLLFANSRERHDEIVRHWAETAGAPLSVRSEDVQRPPSDPHGPTVVVDARPIELPPGTDVQHAERQFLAAQAEAWPDTPIPALDGQTPRQAIRNGRSAEVWALLPPEDEDLALVVGLRRPSTVFRF